MSLSRVGLAFALFIIGATCLARPGDSGTLLLMGAGNGAPGGAVGSVTLSNPPAYITLSGGNLTATSAASGAWGNARTTTTHTTGKYYSESVFSGGSFIMMGGFLNSSALNSTYLGGTTDSLGFYSSSGTGQILYNNAVVVTYLAPMNNTSTYGLAVDVGTHKACITINNGISWSGANANDDCDPVAETNMLDISGVSGALYSGIAINDTGTVTVNYGATSYTGTAPTGYGNW